MIRPVLASILWVCVLLAPLAAAHTETSDDALTHLSVKRMPLAPGENQTVLIETGEGPWTAGMVFILYLHFFSDARDVLVNLTYDHSDVIRSWHFSNTTTHRASTLIPYDEGPYELTVTNVGPNATQLMFYFDQTCNCTTKFITLPGGWVVFDYDLERGKHYFFGYPLVAGWRVHGTVARLVGTSGTWPDDFSTVIQAAGEGPGWVNFTFKAPETGRYYLFLFGDDGVTFGPDGPVPIELTALVEVKEAKGLPMLGVVATWAALAVGAQRGWGRRRRD